jgi:hypothetical protein
MMRYILFANQEVKGLNKLVDIARQNPEQAHQVAHHLRDNPRKVIQQLFRLSAVQASTLNNTSDEDLKQMVAPIADALSQDKLKAMRLQTPPLSDPDAAIDKRLRRRCALDLE